MNTKLFAFACAIACFAAVWHSVTGCASTVSDTNSTGRRRRDVSAESDLTATISALTFFKYNVDKNELNVDSVEEQLREFVSIEQINESKFGKAVRATANVDGFLRVDYILSKGGNHCAELIQLATKAIHFAENVADGEIRCDGEKIVVKKTE